MVCLYRQDLFFDRTSGNNLPGIVHLIVFSNFEGFNQDPEPSIRWFDACSQAHPLIRWTHLYNPRHLLVTTPESIATDDGFSPYLLRERDQGRAEIGLHLHLFYDLVEQAGVRPRANPFAGDTTANCTYPRTIIEDPQGLRGGYDVLITGYTEEERAALLDASIGAFLHRGFDPPVVFCAGYSATDPALQALLASKGFSVSFAAQFVPPNHYGSCWERLTPWSGRITPYSLPYRVSRSSVLPPPHASDGYLNLVELPLNLGVDTNALYLGDSPVSREDVFDRHSAWAMAGGRETAVAIGVHTNVVGYETWGNGPVSKVVDTFLSHVEKHTDTKNAVIQYGTASRVATRFLENKTVAAVCETGNR